MQTRGLERREQPGDRADANSSANSTGVDLIDTSGFTDPDALTVADKLNELITALRR